MMSGSIYKYCRTVILWKIGGKQHFTYNKRERETFNLQNNSIKRHCYKNYVFLAINVDFDKSVFYMYNSVFT